ncbi:MAG: hypothetical protein KME30_00140 [Iphinoe sp. HA4291-MV1]|jgi:hypothetical protein|nr:hypothetical protein [Iphinoe sp. HA4291-MV1]
MNTNLNYFIAKWNHLKQHKFFKKSPVTAILRMAIWGMYCALKIPATIKLPQSGISFYLPPKLKSAG